jgi:hypothetical protein
MDMTYQREKKAYVYKFLIKGIWRDLDIDGRPNSIIP